MKDNLAELLKDDYIRVYKNFSKMILKNGKDINEELQINRNELENNLYIIDNNLKELSHNKKGYIIIPLLLYKWFK